MTVELHVLKDGTIMRDGEGNIMDASSSVTLVTVEGKNVLVDTGMPQDAAVIMAGLEDHGLLADDIDAVVNTHGHHDHTGCNSMFPRAEVVFHRLEGTPRTGGGPIRYVEGDTDLWPGVRVIETPGHTRGSISVVADLPDGIWVMAGDALPTRDNFIAWVPPGINYDPQVALHSMARIVDLASMIVPGHDIPFARHGELPDHVMRHFR